jgi:hypothetical protein
MDLLKLGFVISQWGARGSAVVKALCASWKVAGSSPDEVDFLNWPNPSGRTGPGVDSAS